jgi:hypothetical protein
MTEEELKMTVQEFEMSRGMLPGTIRMGDLDIPDPRVLMKEVKASFDKPIEPSVPLDPIYGYDRWKRFTEAGIQSGSLVK